MQELKRIFKSKYYQETHNRRAECFNDFLEKAMEMGGLKYSELEDVNCILMVILKDFKVHYLVYRDSILKLLWVCKKGLFFQKSFDEKIFSDNLVLFLNLISQFFELLNFFQLKSDEEVMPIINLGTFNHNSFKITQRIFKPSKSLKPEQNKASKASISRSKARTKPIEKL
jgi:hypothetical protein